MLDMGRKFVLKPRLTSISVDVLDAEIIRQFKYTGEPTYLTVRRIMREYAPADLVDKCKARLVELEKNALAHEQYGPETQSTLVNEEAADKRSFQAKPVQMIPKVEYIENLRLQYASTRDAAKEEVQRRIKEGILLERHGYVEEVLER